MAVNIKNAWMVLVWAGPLFGLNGSLLAGGAGTTGGDLWIMGGGARAASMAGAYTAVAEDLETLYYNPAGLALLKDLQADFSHQEWLTAIKVESVSFGQSLWSDLGLGGNITILPLNGDQRTFEDVQGNYSGAAGTVSSTLANFVLGAGWKGRWNSFIPSGERSKIALGTSLKVSTQSLDGNVSASAGFDLGGLYQLVPGESRLGISLQNIGLVSLGKDLPLAVRVGLLQTLLKGSWLLSGDILSTISGGGNAAVGTEYSMVWGDQVLMARAGGSLPFSSPMAVLSAGFGYGYFTRDLEYEVQYAYVPYGDLGTNHRITLKIAFLEKTLKH